MKISRNDPCPCGSDKKYKKCCLPKSIKEDGIIPITSEIQEILDKEDERFKLKMGRDISGDDPIMPSALQMSESVYKSGVSEILNEIGVDPSVIYAFNKVGFCLVEGEEMYTDEQIEQWNAAIEEYEEKELTEEDIESEVNFKSLESIIKTLDKLQFLYALIIRKYGNQSEKIDLVEETNPSDYILFCLTRNLKSLKAISILAINDFPEDAFNLTRTNFENYTEIVYAKYDSKNLVKQLKAENGVLNGTHKRKWKKLVNKSSGEEVNLKSNFEKLNLHPNFNSIDIKLYNLIYSLLSSFTHPDIVTAGQYIDNNIGFTDLKENSNIDPIIVALFINFMIIHELQDLEYFKTSKKDLIIQNKEIAESLELADKQIGKLNKSIKTRINQTLRNYS